MDLLPFLYILDVPFCTIHKFNIPNLIDFSTTSLLSFRIKKYLNEKLKSNNVII